LSDSTFDADAALDTARKVAVKEEEDKAISKQEVKDALVSFAADILHCSGVGLETFVKETVWANKESVLEKATSDFEGETSDLLEGLKKFAKARYALMKLDKPSYLENMLPDISKDLSLTSFPMPLKVNMTGMSKRIGAQETLAFVENSMKALTPVVQKKVNEQFDKKYPNLTTDLVGKMFISEANFTFKLVGIEHEKGEVQLLETMFDDRTNSYKDTEFRETMSIATFQKEFTVLDG